MTLLTLITFMTTMFALVVIPGPGTFAIASKSMAGNLASVSYMILGMVLVDVLFLTFALFGLSAVASIMGELFIIVKYAGAAYLLYLGYKLLSSKGELEKIEEVQSNSGKKDFFIGFAISFSNPKVILFYVSLLPALLDVSQVTAMDIGLLVLCITFVICLVMYGYALVVFKSRKLFESQRAKKNMNRVAGGVMITAAGALVVNG